MITTTAATTAATAQAPTWPLYRLTEEASRGAVRVRLETYHPSLRTTYSRSGWVTAEELAAQTPEQIQERIDTVREALVDLAEAKLGYHGLS